jgi:hypothetical protein
LLASSRSGYQAPEGGNVGTAGHIDLALLPAPVDATPGQAPRCSAMVALQARAAQWQSKRRRTRQPVARVYRTLPRPRPNTPAVTAPIRLPAAAPLPRPRRDPRLFPVSTSRSPHPVSRPRLVAGEARRAATLRNDARRGGPVDAPAARPGGWRDSPPTPG